MKPADGIVPIVLCRQSQTLVCNSSLHSHIHRSESLQAKTPLNARPQRDDFVPTLRSASMAWEVILWVILFIMNVALIASNLYQIVCLTDLEADYMNLYDLSARINAVVIPEMVVRERYDEVDKPALCGINERKSIIEKKSKHPTYNELVDEVETLKETCNNATNTN
ncbi:hypothetical protein R6Q59_025168 [Mikania micrantha]